MKPVATRWGDWKTFPPPPPTTCARMHMGGTRWGALQYQGVKSVKGCLVYIGYQLENFCLKKFAAASLIHNIHE